MATNHGVKVYYMIKFFFVLLISSLSSVVFASVLHISLYEADSKVDVDKNGVIKIRLNFVSSDIDDFKKIQIFLVQGNHKEQMEVKKINDYMIVASINNLELNGKAKLLVKYFYYNKFDVVKEIDINIIINPETYFTSKLLTPLNNVEVTKVDSVMPAINNDVESIHVNNVTLAKDENIMLSNGMVIDTGSIVFYQNMSRESALRSQEKSNCVVNYSGETLWSLSVKYSTKWERELYSTILAIYYTNPHAFNLQNINSIRLDAKLFCPSLEMLTKFGTAEQAKEKFRTLTATYK